MEIISHRGYWKNKSEKNSLKAIDRSLNLGFGVETDIRDLNQRLKVSHDMACNSDPNVTDLLELSSRHPKLPLALNIKSDGLQFELKKLIEEYKITNYFFFDMSFPDTLKFSDLKLNFFLRESEYEKPKWLYNECKGIWIDCFKSIWYSKKDILKHNDNGKMVALVSAELHMRDAYEHWEKLKKWRIENLTNIILCTDYPEEANRYFNI